MRAAARWATVAGLVGAAAAPGLGAAAPAYADSLTPVVSGTNWYWSGKDGATATTPAGNGPFAAPDQASGVPDGDLGVAFTNDVDKVAALDFLLGGIPDGAAVTRFAVTMPLDSTATNLASGTPALVACPAIESFSSAAGPTELSKAPAQALNICVDDTPDAAGTAYVFDLAPFADDWVNGAPANGVVIRPKAGTTAPFNYAFLGRNAIKVDAAFTPAAAAVPTTAPAPAAAPPVQPPTGPVPEVGTMPAVPAPADAPLTAPAPQVLPPAAPVVAPIASAAALRPLPSSLRPGRSFWLTALGLGALVVLAGLVLGDPMEPAALDGSAARRRRFADVIRARAAASSTTAAPARPQHA